MWRLLVLAGLLACDGDKEDTTSGDTEADTDTDTDTDADADADADTDTDTDTDPNADECFGSGGYGTPDPCGPDHTFPCACSLTYDICESGSVYRVDCVNDDAGSMDCECFLNDSSVGSFQDAAMCEFDSPDGTAWVSTVNPGCGFNVNH